MSDNVQLAVFAAVKIFNIKNGQRFFGSKSYAFDGNTVYDFSTHVYARIFHVSTGEFSILNYLDGEFLSVTREKKHIKVIDKDSSETFSIPL